MKQSRCNNKLESHIGLGEHKNLRPYVRISTYMWDMWGICARHVGVGLVLNSRDGVMAQSREHGFPIDANAATSYCC